MALQTPRQMVEAFKLLDPAQQASVTQILIYRILTKGYNGSDEQLRAAVNEVRTTLREALGPFLDSQGVPQELKRELLPA